eukprot:5918095-Amphidinium_carterae.1
MALEKLRSHRKVWERRSVRTLIILCTADLHPGAEEHIEYINIEQSVFHDYNSVTVSSSSTSTTARSSSTTATSTTVSSSSSSSTVTSPSSESSWMLVASNRQAAQARQFVHIHDVHDVHTSYLDTIDNNDSATRLQLYTPLRSRREHWQRQDTNRSEIVAVESSCAIDVCAGGMHPAGEYSCVWCDGEVAIVGLARCIFEGVAIEEVESTTRGLVLPLQTTSLMESANLIVNSHWSTYFKFTWLMPIGLDDG